MNMWLESIANLQRTRPIPVDVEDEPPDHGDETKVCTGCGRKKWIGDFYFKRTADKYRYSSQCKKCICKTKLMNGKKK